MTQEAETKDMKLTPELEAKLKRYRGYLPGSVLLWTPDFFKENTPRSEWPIFKYRTRDALVMAGDADDLCIVNINGVTTTNTNMSLFNITKRQTVGFKNYKDHNGTEVACVKDDEGNITEECWKRISFEVLQEYMFAISAESQLTEDEALGLEF